MNYNRFDAPPLRGFLYSYLKRKLYMTKEEIRKEMDRSHREKFAEEARSSLARNPGVTDIELAKQMEFRYDDTFKRNLVKATDSCKIHAVRSRYYPGERRIY